MTFVTQGAEAGFDFGSSDFPDYQPKRFALNYNPPMIILEYLVPSTGKLYHHKMRLRKLERSSNPQEYLNYLRNRHAMYLNHKKICDEQILGLIGKLIQQLPNTNPEVDYQTLDLNKLTPQEVAEHKQKMDEQYFSNLKRPGDAGFQYDVRQDFNPEVSCDWDEDEDLVL